MAGHIIVHPDFKSGIGKLITESLVVMAHANLRYLYLLAAELGEPVYRKIAFEQKLNICFKGKNQLMSHAQ
ncbi:MAG: hypothetical protein IPN60_12210 [Saprospiraceae bacterium]|nr:hypothetical protein [Candidatus Opimibacter skivensis]